MSLALPQTFGRDLCAALGLEADLARSLSLTVRCDEVVIVTVDHYLTDERGTRVIEVLRRYEVSVARDVTTIGDTSRKFEAP